MAYDSTDAPADVAAAALYAERRLELRNFLLELPRDRFSLAMWGDPECKTPACVAGWANRLFKIVPSLLESPTRIYLAVGDALGLTHQQSREMFLWASSDLKTPVEAAAMLSHFDATGIVDWNA